MHYYIDGYNLMFAILSAEDDLQTQRNQIIQELNEKIQLLELDATLVFDAQYQFGYGSRSHKKFLEICFTDEGETADDYIINELKSALNPRNETVVTNDQRLAWRARRQNATTQSVREFFSWLNSRAKKKRKTVKKMPKTPKPLPPRKTKVFAKPPEAGTTPEESFDYYLYEFEEKLKGTMKEKKEEKPISEMGRWLDIFEKRAGENDQ